MSGLRITRLGHGGVLYRSPADKWLWIDRWSGAPTYADTYRAAERVDVIAPTHGHFDHVGNDAADVVELAAVGGTVVGSHELSIYLASRSVEAIGMNVGGTVEAAGIRLTMFPAHHTGGVTITGEGPDVTREVGCWGWLIEFEDSTRVYHSGDTDVFGDMAFVRDWGARVGVMPIGGHYTMGPEGAARAVELTGVGTVIPVHYATFPILAGTPAQLASLTSAKVVELQPGETWEA
ncbi:MAG TPA: metal-dependent hydrolase [Candidatus Limnocylindria bacterium]|nr:metal-dependent hydrolase [Candidatus Limnocylindria bacterium]